jgi:hypothetical protein
MSWPILNMYTQVLSPEFLDKPRTFPRQTLIRLNLLTTFVAVGSTGSYKTNSVLQIILAFGSIWSSFCLCAKTTDEPLYNWFQSHMAQQKREGNINWYRVCDDLLDLPLLDRPKQPQPLVDDSDSEDVEIEEPYYYGKEKQLNHCIVVDDAIFESPKKLARLNDIVIRGRKYGITLFVISQDWTRTSLTIKRNATYFVLKAIAPRQLKRIAGDVTSDISSEEFVRRYNAATQESHHFMLVDKSLTSAGTLELMFRHNLG